MKRLALVWFAIVGSEGRESQKRTEAQLLRANRKSEQLSGEMLRLGTQLATEAQRRARLQTAFARAANEVSQLRTERESLMRQITTATGKLEAQAEQFESFQYRAAAAEEGAKMR